MPVLPLVLGRGRTGAAVKRVLVEETGALLVAKHTAQAVGQGAAVVAQVEVAGPVAVVTVLPATCGRSGIGNVETDHVELSLVGRLAKGFAERAAPIHLPRSFPEAVLALQGGAEDVLVRLAQTRAAAQVVVHLADLLLAHVHVAAVPCEFVGRGKGVVKLGMGSEARLGCAVGTILRSLDGLARHVVHLGLLAAIGVLIAKGSHEAQFFPEEAVAIGQAGIQIGQRGGIFYMEVVGGKVGRGHAI